MLKKIFQSNIPPPKEGNLYKKVTTFGHTFELRYGYYAESDNYGEPDIIYPDFLDEPLYTANGEPFATMMQDACDLYEGDARRTEDTTCAECKHFERGEEWFGICTNPNNQHRRNE